jgi:hypothetical protein
MQMDSEDENTDEAGSESSDSDRFQVQILWKASPGSYYEAAHHIQFDETDFVWQNPWLVRPYSGVGVIADDELEVRTMTIESV